MKKTTRLQKNKTRTKEEHWTFEMRQALWTMWMLGKSWSEIRKQLDKTQRAVESERWKINIQYYSNDPLSIAGTEQALVRGPNRSGKKLSSRDLVTIRVVKSHAKQNKYAVSVPQLALLLGRPEEEVNDILHPNKNRKAFF